MTTTISWFRSAPSCGVRADRRSRGPGSSTTRSRHGHVLRISREAESWSGSSHGPTAVPSAILAAMMLRYLAEQRDVSDRTEISVFHTWQRPMETFGPLMVDGFGRFLEQREVSFEGGFELERPTRATGSWCARDGRELDYDLAMVVPAHRAPAVIADGMAAEGGYMDVKLPSMVSRSSRMSGESATWSRRRSASGWPASSLTFRPSTWSRRSSTAHEAPTSASSTTWSACA